MKRYKLALMGVMTALMIVSAFIRIPILPSGVPFTAQMLVALIIPMLVGPKYGFGALALYLALGLAGLPVFANGGGIAYVLRPSFGFIVGFALGAIPCGIISRIKDAFFVYLLGGSAAFAIIEFTGGLYFWWIMNFIQDRPLTLVNSFFMSVLPFVPMDLVKLVLAALIAVRLRKFIKIS